MEAKYIDHMGNDLRVVNAARVSFHKESSWDHLEAYGSVDAMGNLDEYGEYPVLSEQDQKLIKYLAKHNHWTPFSHVQITMREAVPIFVARQRFKHMVGFTYNEVSRRYVDDNPDFYVPDTWRSRPDSSIKQGSGDGVVKKVYYDNEEWCAPSGYYEDFLKKAKAIYDDFIAAGIAPEQARMVLPQSMYTEYYVTGSLSAWARAYLLRSDPHAQREIQSLAILWNEVIGGIRELEHSWKALTDV